MVLGEKVLAGHMERIDAFLPFFSVILRNYRIIMTVTGSVDSSFSL